ncbi:MAG: hypothetical protein FWD36_10375, partial [Treponema sp.]|nr:hypothetical protein [Treponema sp.]
MAQRIYIVLLELLFMKNIKIICLFLICGLLMGLPSIQLPVAAAPFGNASDYILESEHIIWDASIEYLTENITPANFADYLSMLDLAYKALVELTGREPYDGMKFKIQYSSHGPGSAHVLTDYPPGTNPIIFCSLGLLTNGMRGFSKENPTNNLNADSYSNFNVIVHEMSHIFDNGFIDKWDFATEFLADFKRLYVLQQLDISETEEERIAIFHTVFYNYIDTNPAGLRNALNHDGMWLYFKPILDGIGWEPVKSTFRSFHDGSYIRPEHYSVFGGNGSRLYDFLDRLTHFSGINTRDLIAPKALEFLYTVYPHSGIVSFQPDNGTEPITKSFLLGTTVTEIPAEVDMTAPDGKVFMGWYYIDEGVEYRTQFPFIVLHDRILYAKWGNRSNYMVPSDIIGAYIDLESEELILPEDFIVDGYSINGGKTWKKGTLSSNAFKKLLNKELTLVLTTGLGHKPKQPYNDAEKITFEKIEKRPKANAEKLRLNYGNFADPDGTTPGAWSLAVRGVGSAVFEGYQIAQSANGKLSTIDSWIDMPNNGIEVLP